jgi:hypothetical protein
MGKVSLEAGHRPAIAAKHRGAKPPGGAKRPDTRTVRCQLHLGEQTQKRLAVHAALVERNASRVADEILLSYLTRHGKGRAIFDSPEEVGDPADDGDDDRQVEATPERKSEAEPDTPGGSLPAAPVAPPGPPAELPSGERPGRRRKRHRKRSRGEAGRAVEAQPEGDIPGPAPAADEEKGEGEEAA